MGKHQPTISSGSATSAWLSVCLLMVFFFSFIISAHANYSDPRNLRDATGTKRYQQAHSATATKLRTEGREFRENYEYTASKTKGHQPDRLPAFSKAVLFLERWCAQKVTVKGHGWLLNNFKKPRRTITIQFTVTGTCWEQRQ